MKQSLWCIIHNEWQDEWGSSPVCIMTSSPPPPTLSEDEWDLIFAQGGEGLDGDVFTQDDMREVFEDM